MLIFEIQSRAGLGGMVSQIRPMGHQLVIP